MKRVPPPPPNTKKSTKMPPPTRVVHQSKEQNEKVADILLNNLDQQQQRPQVFNQRIPAQNLMAKKQNSKEKQQIEQPKQALQQQTQLEQLEDNFNKEEIIPEQIQSTSNAQQQISFERKAIPAKTVPPTNSIRKNFGPPPPPKSKLPFPIKHQQIKQIQIFEHKQQPVVNKEEQRINNVQEKHLQHIESQIEKNEIQTINIQNTIPKNNTSNRGVPQPPKSKILSKTIKLQSQESPQTQTPQQNISNNSQATITAIKSSYSQVKKIQQTIRVKTEKQPEIQKLTILKGKGNQDSSQKSVPKSKLQEKLQQLRKAKEQMTQQYEQERVQTEEDYVKEQNNDENKQIVDYLNEFQSDKAQIVEQPIVRSLQIRLESTDNYQIKQTKNESINKPEEQVQRVQINRNEMQIQSVKPKQKNKKTLPPPPTSKGKFVVPSPNIRSAPKPVVKQLNVHQPTSNQIKSSPNDYKDQQYVGQDFKTNLTQNKNQVKVEQTPVLVTNEPKIVKKQVQKVEVELPKPVQSAVANQINKLLQRYHSLKSIYVSNIHQLEELVNFTKKQQQAQIQKINRLLQQLNKKNQQIKQVCGLKSETNLEEITTQQEQLAV